MNDMSQAIIPKADQISADDLLSGPLTIQITSVSIRPGTEQPVSINFADDGGRPWKPCKSMSRVLVAAWGPDANVYIGRSATLYRDPSVKWGGMEVGGIRVSHLSDIKSSMVLALTATKGSKKPFTVKPLVLTAPAAQTAETGLPIGEWLKVASAELKAAPSAKDVQAILARDDVQVVLADDSRPKARDRLRAAVDEAITRTAALTDDEDIEDAEEDAPTFPSIENDPAHEAA